MIKFGLEGKTFAITGGASGIGLATAKALAREGASVALLDLRQDDINRALEQISLVGPGAIGIAVDVCDEKALATAAAQIVERMGIPYGLLGSAGTATASPAEDQTLDEWERVLRVNATGLFLSCRTFGNLMLKAGAGSIVAIGSISGLGAQAARVAYCSSKFAVNGMVKTLALEWGRRNVRVNCIAPTLVNTPLLQANLPRGFVELARNRTPMARIASADDIAMTALSLMSDAMSFVNGVILPVDGGLTTGYFTNQNGVDLSSKRLLEAGLYSE